MLYLALTLQIQILWIVYRNFKILDINDFKRLLEIYRKNKKNDETLILCNVILKA